MTYSPEARHFVAEMPRLQQGHAEPEGGGEVMMASPTVEYATEAPASRWRSNWVVANSHWPR